MKPRNLVRRFGVVATAAALVSTGTIVHGDAAGAAPATLLPAALLPTPAPVEQRTAQTMTADALPTVQINAGGIVWAQVVVGDTVYVGGKFTAARPAGAADGVNTTPRSNLLAYNIRTGQLVPGWAPTTNGTVKSITASPDGSRIYVGGTFSQANGTTRWNIAAFDATTGALTTTFKPSVGGSYVNAIAATDNAVYVGGLISAGNGVARKNLMAFTTTGQLTGWAPTADLQVDAMVRAPGTDKLIVGGRFATVNDVTQRGLAALSLIDGSIQAWTAQNIVKNGASSGPYTGKAGIHSLSADGTFVFGTGWVYAPWEIGNLEGVFSAQAGSGDLNFILDCHGDHYSVYSDSNNVYSTSHAHNCQMSGGFPQKDPAPGNMRNATAVTAEAKGTLAANTNGHYANWAGYPAPAHVNWYPDWYTGKASGQGQAGWTVVGTGDYISVGGEFPGVNGQAQYGLVRFGRSAVAPKKQGPRLSGATWIPSGGSVRSTQIRVSIPINWDRDDRDLTYRLVRSGTAEPIATVQKSASFWESGRVTLDDNTVRAGQTYTYRVDAVDGDGNVARSQSISVTASSSSLSAYANRVLDDEPSLYWRLGEGTGPVTDLVGGNPGTAAGGVTTAAGSGAIAGDTDKASSFDGTEAGRAVTDSPVPVTSEFTVEAWFSTTTNQGGKIVGYGRSASGLSSNYDRHVWMRNDGRIMFGTYTGATNVITSPTALNDGAWHHVVASQSAQGMRLYVDGVQVGSHPATSAENYVGHWRLGGDNLNGWPDQPNSVWFSGSIDEFAVYDRALTGAAVQAHYDAGAGNFPPSAAFTSTTSDLTVSFDGTGSSAAAGRTITGYSWDFGDGSPEGTGATASHTYAAAGTYTVTLTVTDSTGKTGTVSHDVSVMAPHGPPTAVIDSSANGLTVAFDGTGSTATDGETIAAYDWDFGDGATATTARPNHAYAQAGSYTVTLRVRDSAGAWSTPVEAQVSVTHADPTASFTAAADGRRVAVDASGSTATDGATMTYAWSWGDGSADGSGRTASHTYGADGTYTITLTVTDSLGSTSTATRQVTVTAPTSVVSDAFGRTVATGWDSADVGGPWVGSAGLSVAGGTGVVTLNKSVTRTASLNVSVADSDSRFTVSTDKVANGGGLHVNYAVHRSADGLYRVKLRFGANGVVNVGLAKLVGTTETLIANKVLSGYTHTAGSVLNVRLETVTAGGTTTLRTKVWAAGDAEPGSWYVTASDRTASLQAAGGVGFSFYGTGTMTNGPVRVLVDDLDVR